MTRTPRGIRASACLAITVAGAVWVHAAGQPKRDPGAPVVDPRAAELARRVAEIERTYANRLTELDPAAPDMYLRLAEEVAEADDPGARQLATHLFVLAAELDRRAGGRSGTATSACRGLAAMSKSERERRWLDAIARALDPRRSDAAWRMLPVRDAQESGVYKLATTLGEIRAGNGAAARKLLDDTDVRAALRRYERVIWRVGISGGLAALEREASRWPCPDCGNDRVIKKPRAGAAPEFRLCPTCAGKPGPKLTNAELASQLRFESWLLQGDQRSWAAQLGVDQGAPLVDPDAGALAPAFAVDPTRVLWRNGAWVAEPGAAQPDAKPAPPTPDTPTPDKPEPKPPAAPPPQPTTTSGP